jgi:hypothetical protein
MTDPDTKRRRFADFVAGMADGRLRVRIKDEDDKVVFDATPFVLELVRANGGWHEPDEFAASKFLTEGKERVRKVGKDVYDRFGHHGMVAVHDVIQGLLPDGAARELEFAWDGIGDWKC